MLNPGLDSSPIVRLAATRWALLEKY